MEFTNNTTNKIYAHLFFPNVDLLLYDYCALQSYGHVLLIPRKFDIFNKDNQINISYPSLLSSR